MKVKTLNWNWKENQQKDNLRNFNDKLLHYEKTGYQYNSQEVRKPNRLFAQSHITALNWWQVF